MTKPKKTTRPKRKPAKPKRGRPPLPEHMKQPIRRMVSLDRRTLDRLQARADGMGKVNGRKANLGDAIRELVQDGIDDWSQVPPAKKAAAAQLRDIARALEFEAI